MDRDEEYRYSARNEPQVFRITRKDDILPRSWDS